MPIPSVSEAHRAFLELLSNGERLTLKEMVNRLSEKFNLTEEERRLRVPSGSDTYIKNRASWARSRLRIAGFVSQEEGGLYLITNEGKVFLNKVQEESFEVSEKALVEYSEKYKEHYSSYRAKDRARRLSPKVSKEEMLPVIDDQVEPDERIKSDHKQIQNKLASDLLDEINQKPVEFLKKLILDVLVAMGYGGSREDAEEHLGRVGDEGIDGLIKQDKLGLDKIYFQAKAHKEDSVSSDEIEQFADSLKSKRVSKGIFITTSHFASEAFNFVNHNLSGHHVVLIDGDELVRYMIDHDVGVSKVNAYVIKKIDSDYFEDDM